MPRRRKRLAGPSQSTDGLPKSTLSLHSRPFLKSNSRLRMPGRAGPTISSARFLSPSLTLLWDSLRQVSRNSLKDRKRRGLSAQDFLALSPYSAPVLSVPRGYPSDSRNATLPEKVPPAGQSVLCFEKGSKEAETSAAEGCSGNRPFRSADRYLPLVT